MISANILFAVLGAALVLAAGMAYRAVWRRLRGPDLTPTGFGALLAPVLLAAAILAGAPSQVVAAYGVICAATMAYWLDDVIELSPRLRLAISFITGAAICWFSMSDQPPPALVLAGFCVGAGVLNIVLTNIVNFYDGADLNVAMLFALIGGTTWAFGSPGSFVQASAVAILCFTLPFAFLNRRPKTIYCGDSGCFAMASFITLIIVSYFHKTGDFAAPAITPMALPALDVFYVLVLRIVQKHDLLTRNYLHLYQKLQARGGFAYLAPQPANLALALGATYLLHRAGMGDFSATLVGAGLVTVVFYLAARRRLIGWT